MSTYSSWAMEQAADLAGIYADAWDEVEPMFADLAAKEEKDKDRPAVMATLLLWRLPQLQSALEAAASKAQVAALASLDAMTQEAVTRASAELPGSVASMTIMDSQQVAQELKATLTNYLDKYTKDLTTATTRALRTGQLQGESVSDITQKLESLFGRFVQPESARAMLSNTTGTAHKVGRLVFDQLQRGRSAIYQYVLANSPDAVGIKIVYGGGPCPSQICIRRAGTYYGEDALAELQRWPRHPWCRCRVSFLNASTKEI